MDSRSRALPWHSHSANELSHGSSQWMAASDSRLSVSMQLKIPEEEKVNLKIILTRELLFPLFEQPYPHNLILARWGAGARGIK